LEKKVLQLYPSLAAEILANGCNTPNKFLLDGKFFLINGAFSDELSDEALRGEQCATCTKLDAGLVGFKSLFCVTV
jgi:hypothetical protein